MDYLLGWDRAIPVEEIEPSVDQTSNPDPKAGLKAFWAAGDWAEIAKGLDGAAEELVRMVAIEPGDKVLDVAAGNGNAAIWAARRGASVVATDICPEMVAKGMQRSGETKLHIDWHESDFEDLPFANAEFDHVISAFGVMFAENPRLVASEIFRVTKPGGTVGIVNWTPHGWPAVMGEIMSRYTRSSPSRIHAPDWGMEEDVRLLLAPYALDFKFQIGTVWSWSDSLESWWDGWDRNSPMMVAARKRISPAKYQCLSKDLIDSVRKASIGNGPSPRWESEYLIATAKKSPNQFPRDKG